MEKLKNALIGYSAVLNYWNVEETELSISRYLTPYWWYWVVFSLDVQTKDKADIPAPSVI